MPFGDGERGRPVDLTAVPRVFDKTGMPAAATWWARVFFAHYEPRLRDNERRAATHRHLRGGPVPLSWRRKSVTWIRLGSALMGLEIRQVAYDSADAVALTNAVQAEYVVMYGGEDETPVVPTEFAPPGGGFLVAYLDGHPVGCGGFRPVDAGVAELKRMYVRPAARGRGVARAMLAALEQAAAAAGCRQLILETGSQQPEALGLYASSGYTAVPAFGTYHCAPGARHLGKSLADQAAVPG